VVTTTTTRAAPLLRPRLSALARLAAWHWPRLALGAVLALPWQWLGRDRRTSRRSTRSSAVRITLSSTIILRSVVVRSSSRAGPRAG
jgi:hypothetical protein